MIIMGARPGRSLGLLLLVLLIAACGLFRPRFTAEYRRELVLSAPWGEDPGAFGRAKAQDGDFWGPRSFDVSRTSIVVADSVNYRLQVFDLRGRLTRTIPLEMPDNSRFFAGDVIFYRDGYAACDIRSGQVLQHFGDKWEVVHKISPPSGTAAVVHEGLAAVRDGFLYYAASFLCDLKSEWQLWRLAPGSPELVTAVVTQVESLGAGAGISRLAPELPGLVLGFSISPGGRLHLQVAGPEQAQAAILTFDLASGRNLSVLELVRAPGTTAQLVGVDGHSRSYLAHFQQGKLSSVVVHGAQGEPIGMIHPQPSTVRGLVDVRVDEQGRIYVLTRGEEGLSLNRYSPQRALEIIPRWKTP